MMVVGGGVDVGDDYDDDIPVVQTTSTTCWGPRPWRHSRASSISRVFPTACPSTVSMRTSSAVVRIPRRWPVSF